MNGLRNYAGQRCLVVSKLALSIFLDAILFVCWLTIAWSAELVAQYFEQHGLHEFFARAFNWTSSGATFILTVLYIIRDIMSEVTELFRRGGQQHVE
jgi:hypothetical protein